MTYDLVGAAPPGSDLIYFAFGNYTTLGHGDVRPVDGWRLLGPMTALNGIMLKCFSINGNGRNPMGSGLFHVAHVATCSPLFNFQWVSATPCNMDATWSLCDRHRSHCDHGL